MAGEWREYRIGEIADIIGGSTPSTADPSNFDGEIPWLTPKDLSGPHDRYVSRGERSLSRKGLESCSAQLLPPGTVLLTSRAPIGYVAIAKNSVATNQGFRNLIPKPGMSSEFLYYWLKGHVEELQRHASGSTFQELSGTALAQIGIRVPPLPEQRAIAHILGTLDDKIELNRRMSETLEQMARALFKAWFIDFEPVRAKMEGRWQRGQSHPGLPAHLYDLFPDRLVDSEQGEIPEGWRVGTLGELSEKPQYGYTASAREEPVGPKFLRITDINKLSWIDWSTVPFCEIGQEDLEQYRLHPGDVLIARMADPGHGVVIEEEVEAVFASYLIRFRLKDHAYVRYIQYWLRSDGYWDLVASRHAGTTRASLNAQVLSTFQVIIPPKQIVSAFGEIVNNLRNKVVAAVNESRTLTALRDTLLPKLISGELRVRDAERFLKERGL
jgi:type I restriction enzyme S subunit